MGKSDVKSKQNYNLYYTIYSIYRSSRNTDHGSSDYEVTADWSLQNGMCA